MLDLDKEFHTRFPILAEKFSLKDFQKLAITSVIKKDNTLCIMPTGGGKSLIYWLSGLLTNGITIVISPLIALMEEQAEKIIEQGYEAMTFHGGIDAAKQVKILIDFANKKTTPDFIFVSPEKIATDGFFEHCIKTRRMDISLIVIDEVHCVSQWGFSFRPFYKRIPDFVERISEKDDTSTPILALTATLNPKELGDICSEFFIKKENIVKDNDLMRKEITLHVKRFNDENEKEEKFWDIVKIHRDEKILVYVYRKYKIRGVEQLAQTAMDKGYRAVHFHGDLTANQRKDIITQYKNNEVDIVFATNAFGMGIDIPDIRVVIHFMIPDSVEQYYQEIGRAARDGKTSNAYLLYSNKNIDFKRTYFIDASFPDEDKLEATFKKLASQGVGLHTLPYFEDEEIKDCLPYFLDNGLIKIIDKGFSGLKSITAIKEKDLNVLLDCTKTKNLISTISKSGLSPSSIIKTVYDSLIIGNAKTSKPLDKCLIVEVLFDNIPPSVMNDIQNTIDEKRRYKNGLLDYLVYLISNFNSSNELHQEIANYLGVDKHTLNKIFSTSKGDLVRSKSEVIIANLLWARGIEYEYEKKLMYDPNKWLEPDFAVKSKSGKEVYWEHLGMLGVESYDNRWIEKRDIYDQHFKDQLVVTYEGATISDSATEIIDDCLLD